MLRSQMRKALRFRLGDMHPTNPIFSDDNLNVSLEESARELQNWVNLVDPNPYVDIQYGDLTQNKTIYILPTNYRSPGVREVALLVNNKYVPIGRREFIKLNATNAASETSTENSNKYSIGGGIIKLQNPPTNDLALGMRMEYSAVVSFNDSDIVTIQLPLELHKCVYLLSLVELSPIVGVDTSKIYENVEKKFLRWAEGFKSTIGPDGEQINTVGGHNRLNWDKD